MKLVQPLSGAAEALFEFAGDVPVIDCHEHIPRTEKDYNGSKIRFGNLFNPYVSNDLYSSGMTFPEGQWPAFVCIEDDWDAFAPHWKASKHSSYARAIRLALQKFYGVDDFTRENYLEIVKRINENNTPGIYDRIFKETCGIERVVRCAGDLPDRDDPLLAGNINSPALVVHNKESLEGFVKSVGASTPKTLDDLAEICDVWMKDQAKKGAMEFKAAAHVIEDPIRAMAEDALQLLLAGKSVHPEPMGHLTTFLREQTAKTAGELGLPVALHTGVWGDFRTVSVQDVIGFVQRNPGTRIDIYHLGIPEVRQAAMIVKNFPNAYLNLCWAHIVASDMTVNTLKEAIDLLPLNKVFAFGADYVLFIEKVWGHLHMAKENVSIVLGDRVDRQLMGLDEAKAVLKDWFYGNPKVFYGF